MFDFIYKYMLVTTLINMSIYKFYNLIHTTHLGYQR